MDSTDGRGGGGGGLHLNGPKSVQKRSNYSDRWFVSYVKNQLELLD